MYAQNGKWLYAYEYMTPNINLYMLTNICLYRNQLDQTKVYFTFCVISLWKNIYVCTHEGSVVCCYCVEVHKNKGKKTKQIYLNTCRQFQ